jgi:hypothetical protein
MTEHAQPARHAAPPLELAAVTPTVEGQSVAGGQSPLPYGAAAWEAGQTWREERVDRQRSALWLDGAVFESTLYYQPDEPISPDHVTFGAWVRDARTLLRFSQAKLGELVGLHQTTISRIERGVLKYLRFRHVVRLMVPLLAALAGRAPRRL